MAYQGRLTIYWLRMVAELVHGANFSHDSRLSGPLIHGFIGKKVATPRGQSSARFLAEFICLNVLTFVLSYLLVGTFPVNY